MVEGGRVVTVNSAVVGEGRRMRRRGAVVSIVGDALWWLTEEGCRGRVPLRAVGHGKAVARGGLGKKDCTVPN